MLTDIDHLEKTNGYYLERIIVPMTDGSIEPQSPEQLAEKLIADCSANLSLIRAAGEMPDGAPARAVAKAWETNLGFMKWWLENRRRSTHR